MGMIEDVLAWLDNKRRVAGRNTSDLLNDTSNALSKTGHQAALEIADVNNYGPGAMKGMLGLTAWHGSPHKFDKFSLDKIGTGEGAQAYGHGLYLAEAPDVATQYAKMFEKNQPKTTQLVKLRDSAPQGSAEWKHYNDLIDTGLQGQLYKTDIPDEAVARFLDWDKPLSQQAPEVQAALKSMTDDVSKGGFDLSRSPRNVARAFDDSSTEEAFKVLQQKYGVTNSGGQYFDKNGNPVPADAVQRHIDKIAGKGYDNAGQLYSDLTHILGSQSDISATLRNNGIPGIRYLDGGSRGAGQGSSNFVVFDPEMIRILERNGQATGKMPWKPNEFDIFRDTTYEPPLFRDTTR